MTGGGGTMARGNTHRTSDGQGEPAEPSDLIEFTHRAGVYTGVGSNDRLWHITPSLTGWRLDFRDPGDERPTYAGTHASLDAAQREASSDPPRQDPDLPRQGRRQRR